MGAVILETYRLILRPWREEDAPRLYDLCRDPEIGPAAGWSVHQSAEESREVIRTVLSGPRVWAITLRDSELPVGSVGLKDTTAVEDPEPELGYWVGRAYWGRAYVPEACEAVLEYCFTMLGERRVWCAHYEDNDRSRRVIMKCGFLPMFTRLEWVEPLNEERRCRYYALTVEQWRVRHNTRSWRVKQ